MDVTVDVEYIDHHYMDERERDFQMLSMSEAAKNLVEFLPSAGLSHDGRRATLHLQYRIGRGEGEAEEMATEMVGCALHELGVPHSELGTLAFFIDFS